MAFMNQAGIANEPSLLGPYNPVETDARAREHFPSSGGLMVKDEAPNNFGVSDIIVHEYRTTAAGTLFRHVFLIVQCKRVLYESRDLVWREAEIKLEGYLRATHQNTRLPNTTPVYGAVAVGRKICFYTYNPTSKMIRGWRPSAHHSFDLGSAGDPRLIENALRFILLNH
ncbi:hypothetical protein SI65_03617 [Aspergillus cristatus]|uniref:Fungal-type protein kinase domain-containing protein n=1 Tax=Aspergillus cristatus TaxID=573508 RepID=A0A1E3BHZ0_ASPCR|nr:hypothetical protein SI65_03617 [Aspergillus cristatus]